MKYERFEQLPVWQAAIDPAAVVDALTDKPAAESNPPESFGQPAHPI